MLDDQLLEQYIHTFYGYGNYQGDFWFVGKEEGGGGSVDDILQRLTAWSRRGRRELEDVCAYHEDFGVTHLFSQRPTIQRTWGKLIRSLLKAKGQAVTVEQIRAYQGQHLAREDGETCLLELLPPPSPSTGQWLYASCSQLVAGIGILALRIFTSKSVTRFLFKKKYLTFKPRITSDFRLAGSVGYYL